MEMIAKFIFLLVLSSSLLLADNKENKTSYNKNNSYNSLIEVKNDTNNTSKSTGGVYNNSGKIVIQSGANFIISDGNYRSEGTSGITDSGTFKLAGNFVNNNISGNPVSTNGTVILNGSNSSSITDGMTFYNLTFAKSNDNVQITTSGVISFTNTLTITNGYFKGGLRTTRTGTSFSAVNFLEYTLPSDAGVTITRYSGNTAPGAENAIMNYVTVTSTTNVAPTSIKVYFNKDQELNGSDQNLLIVWQQVGEANWAKLTNDPAITNGTPFSNWLKPNVSNDLSVWSVTTVKYTAMDNTFTSLPVAFDDENFYAKIVNNAVELTWITHSEDGLKGFIVYRSTDANDNFEEIARWTENSVLETKNDGGFSTNDTEYTFRDIPALSNTYYYKIESYCADDDRQFHPKTVSIDFITKEDDRLFQNFPNPFNAQTSIGFYISQPSNVHLYLYNSNGEIVKELIKNSELDKGIHSITINSENLTSGIYFYNLKVKDKIFTKRMVYIK
ncbi:MAG: T9SS type A sorting domain-containing protein [Candidatus Delongbacteria bacterium]|nr:T9SS type A sorting domain-containing protein [Candidatus Delongbacteria bacterium]MBN2833641.1 T9SS type A sorting domain-containing protein [Candidatus Delongbacteria bacterium]